MDEDADSGSADEGEVLADSTTDPDTQEPVSGPQGDVQDEIATEGPLPNTLGISFVAIAAPIVLSIGGLLAFGAIVVRRARD